MIEYIKYRHAISHLKAAEVYSKNSHAKRLQVGAVLMKGDIPISMGWNGRLPGQDNECEITNPDGSLITRPDVRHAEINALNKLHRSSETAKGAVMFCTHAACVPCAMDIVHAGVRAFVFENEYRDIDGLYYLYKNNVSVYQWIESEGAFYKWGEFDTWCDDRIWRIKFRKHDCSIKSNLI